MTLYRKPAPYRKSQTYRGSEVVVPTVPPSMFGASTNPWMDAIDHQADTILPWSIAKIRDGATAVPWSQSRVHANAIVAAWIQAAAHGFDAIGGYRSTCCRYVAVVAVAVYVRHTTNNCYS